jgi:hypothetical protein
LKNRFLDLLETLRNQRHTGPMFKSASDTAQARRDKGQRATPGPKPMLKKERAAAAKREKRRGKPGSWKRLVNDWDD